MSCDPLGPGTAQMNDMTGTPARQSATSETPGAGPANALTVDVEDYFQVEAFAGHISRADWDGYPCRVERNTDRILEIFSGHGVEATFFVLGWVAEKFPGLVTRINDAGHEIASHGFHHRLVFTQTPDDFRDDVRRAKSMLEDLTGAEVKGYRAPSFSIGADSLWALDILAEEGYRYSSSIFPIHHDLYGMPDAPRFAFKPCQDKGTDSGFLELPATTVKLFDHNIPCAGGGYFRILPYAFSRWAWRRVHRTDGQPCIFYFHPWEIDPDQPRQHQAGLKSKLRHYTNLGRMERKLHAALDDFSWRRMDRIFLPDQKT